MIVLDTNVLSEIMKPNPDPHVLSWVDSVPALQTAITAVTAEETIFDEEFRNRIFVFDAQIAAICRVHKCTPATRYIKDFDLTGVTTRNPWGGGDPMDGERTGR